MFQQRVPRYVFFCACTRWDFSPATCPWKMSLLHVPEICPCYMSLQYAPAICPFVCQYLNIPEVYLQINILVNILFSLHLGKHG